MRTFIRAAKFKRVYQLVECISSLGDQSYHRFVSNVNNCFVKKTHIASGKCKTKYWKTLIKNTARHALLLCPNYLKRWVTGHIVSFTFKFFEQIQVLFFWGGGELSMISCTNIKEINNQSTHLTVAKTHTLFCEENGIIK